MSSEHLSPELSCWDAGISSSTENRQPGVRVPHLVGYMEFDLFSIVCPLSQTGAQKCRNIAISQTGRYVSSMGKIQGNYSILGLAHGISRPGKRLRASRSQKNDHDRGRGCMIAIMLFS